jgi:cysteine-rich repeat protein
VVPDNVKIVFAVRQEYSSPCLGFLCGGAVTSTADGPQLKQILMSANSPDPEGPALLDRVLEEYRAAHGGDLPNNATDLHKFMDQSQTIRELSGAWVGRPCTRRKCGNGRLNQGEECDDGNTAIGDGCRADCTLERCGDVIPDPGEQCDDGNLVDGDGCDSNCTLTGCGNGIVTTGEQCDGSVDSACPGRCIPPGQENECQCRPLDLSGTWSIYLAGPVTGTGQERICNLCPDPPDTGPLCQDSSGAGILMYPHIISSDSFGRGINVQQTGNSLAYEAQGPCGAHDFCTDTLTGSINGNSVSLVLTQEKDISGDFSRRAIGATTHRISGTIISSTRIVGDDDISVERRDRYECHTYDATSMSDEPGPVEITISPAP